MLRRLMVRFGVQEDRAKDSWLRLRARRARNCRRARWRSTSS